MEERACGMRFIPSTEIGMNHKGLRDFARKMSKVQRKEGKAVGFHVALNTLKIYAENPQIKKEVNETNLAEQEGQDQADDCAGV